MLKQSLPLGCALLALGCYGPENEFNKFNYRCERTTDSICVERTTGPVDTDCEFPEDPTQEDLDLLMGTFFIGISSGIPTAELFPTMQQVEISNPVENADGTITISLASRAVAACDPSMPVEDFDPAREFTIQPDGSLTLPLGEQAVPTEGNAIIPAPIRSEVTLMTRVCRNRPDFICGTTVGQLFEPVMSELNGTFGLIRTSMHGEVPDPILLDCAETEAAPISEFPVCMAM